MRRDEAEKLIGQQVSAWTAANGRYVGILQSIAGSPWRGKVLITGVLEPAQHYELGAVCRRGFRPGETIEVGNSAVRACDNPGHSDYLEALLAAAERHENQVANNPTSPSIWAVAAAAQACRKIIVVEERRIETGEWKITREDQLGATSQADLPRYPGQRGG